MAGEPVNVNEFEELAMIALLTFQKISIRPRVLVDVSRINMSTVILSHRTSAPIIVAPTASHQLSHPEGEVATAGVAAACNIIMGLACTSTCTLEKVASSCKAFKREITADRVQRAECNGFSAIILTADTPRPGRKEADTKNKMIAPPFKNFEGLILTEVVSDKGSNEAYATETLDPSFYWKVQDLKDIAWLKSITKLPILIKGIVTCEATKAIEAGVAGIIVSNHGSWQLDYTPATISILEEVILLNV